MLQDHEVPLGTDVGALWVATNAPAGVLASPYSFWQFATDFGHPWPLPLLSGFSGALAT